MHSRFLNGLTLAALALATTGCSEDSVSGSKSADVKLDESSCSALAEDYPGLDGRELTVGISPAPANYSAADPANPNNIIGIEPDLLNAAGECLGFTTTYSKLDFAGLVPALQSGRINLVAAGMYSSEERVQQVDFVEYMKAGEASLVEAGNPEGIESLEDICGVTAALVVGTVESEIIEEQSGKCEEGGESAVETLSFPSTDRAQAAVAQGKADFFLTDAGVAAYLAEKSGDKMEVGFDLPTEFRFGFGVSKSDTELRDALHAALLRLHEDGTLQDAMGEWGFSSEQELEPSIATDGS
jgi:polar amino acid transport system substrate-binding protein